MDTVCVCAGAYRCCLCSSSVLSPTMEPCSIRTSFLPLSFLMPVTFCPFNTDPNRMSSQRRTQRLQHTHTQSFHEYNKTTVIDSKTLRRHGGSSTPVLQALQFSREIKSPVEILQFLGELWNKVGHHQLSLQGRHHPDANTQETQSNPESK